MAAAFAAAAGPCLAAPDWNGFWTRISDPGNPSLALAGTSFRPGELPELTPEYQAIADRAAAALARGSLEYDKTLRCEPPGMPLMMSFANGGEILMTPGRVTLIAEWAGDVRRIFIDGRDHPADLDPTYQGHSIGHWEGDELVVDTVAISPKASLTLVGLQQSDQMHIVERIREYAPGRLEIAFRIEDAVAFVRPWEFKVTWRKSGDPLDYAHEYTCENNRNLASDPGAR